MNDSKYLVWKRDEMEKWMSERATEGLPSPVLDAVVIRRQDVFAPPALDAYANAMQTVIEMLEVTGYGEDNLDKLRHLRTVADYFHAQASISWDTERKLPD